MCVCVCTYVCFHFWKATVDVSWTFHLEANFRVWKGLRGTFQTYFRMTNPKQPKMGQIGSQHSGLIKLSRQFGLFHFIVHAQCQDIVFEHDNSLNVHEILDIL